jgi:hypothetical protein
LIVGFLLFPVPLHFCLSRMDTFLLRTDTVNNRGSNRIYLL